MRNSRLLRVFGLVAFLLAMVHTSVWGHNTHYGKVTVSMTGEGTVYIAKSKTATSGSTIETWNCDGDGDNDSKTFFLFATPAEGYMFKNWTTDSGTSLNNPYEISVKATETNSNPSPFAYTATFEKVLYSATVKVAADGGTATVDGEQSSTKKGSASTDGTFSFKLEATANSGYEFKGWARSLEGEIVSTNNPFNRQVLCTSSNPNQTEDWFAIFEQEGQTEEDETHYINPILDADTEDPSVILAQDGFYYLYSSEMKLGEGMPVWRSADLVNWTCITYIFASRPSGVSASAKLLSPDIAYVNGKYLLYYSCARSSDGKTQIHVATSDKPYGPFSSDKALLMADYAKTPSLFQDTDGKNYLVFGEIGKGIFYNELDAACTSTANSVQRLANSNLGEMLEIKAPVIVKHKANDGKTYTYLFATRKFHKSIDEFDNKPRPKSLAQETELVCVRTDGSLSSTFKDQEGREVFTNATGKKKGTMLSILKTNNYVLSPGHNTQILTVKNQAGKTEEWILYHGYSWDGRKQNLENVKTDRYQLFAEKIEWEEWYKGFPGLTPPTQEPLPKPVVDTEKQKESSYKITNAEELKKFAEDVNEGEANFSNALLMNDIDCSSITSWTPIGAFADYKYQGVIDGQGHQILNLKVSQGENAALVSYAGPGATFKNIIIHSSCSFASTWNCGAAFVAQASGPGNVTFEKCGNEANVSAGWQAGAFVGCADNNIQVVINTCYNTGDVSVLGNNGTDGNGAGAFVGKVNQCTLKINNSWNNGLVNVIHDDWGDIDNGLFAGNSTETQKYSVTKTYDLKNVSSTSTALAYGKPSGYTDDWYYNGHLTYLLNEEKGSRVWYQKLGEDDHPMLFTRGGDIVYKAMGCDGKHATTGGFSEGGYTNSSRGASHAYEFELSSTELSKKCKNCSNLYSSLTVPVNAGWLEVSDANQMEMTMDYVNSGSEYNSIKSIDAKIRLMNDIDFTSKGTKMYGVEKANYRFAGQFDGDFHKVTINYVANGNFTALFRSTIGATIKNLYVAGSITNNGGYTGCGGVVGFANTPIIEKCLSSVSYNDSKSTSHTGNFGGVIGKATLTSTVELKNCGFVGKVSAPNAIDNGGLVGTIVNASRLTVKNSYVAANINWKSGEEICNAGKKTDCYSYAPNAEQVTGGQLCYDLNNGQSPNVWKQSIGVQPYPIFSGDDVDMVVDANNDEKFYYNGIYTRIKNEEKKEYFTPGDWFTICIPYGSAFIEGGEVYSIAGLGKNSTGDPSSLKLYSHEQMVAGTPYICRATDNTFKVYYTAAEAKEAGIVNGLWGTFVDFPFSQWSDYGKEENEGAGVYVLTGNMLKRASSKSGVKANRAFVVMSKVKDIARDQAGVKMLTLGFEGMEDDVQTAVDEIKTVDITSTPVYNLQGQRVQNPSHGIFIVNGKKVYIK